jgi:tRNA(Ile)-lysidine synthase
MARSPTRGFSASALESALADLPSARRYWVAYSGGLDSSVLLHALAEIRQRLTAPIEVLHLDHGLHPDSPRWADHCRDQCERLQLPCTQRRLLLVQIPGDGLEARAREARLAAFRDLLEPGDLLLTAQHRDDQAETVLLQLLRGSGLDGLSAMPLLTSLGRGYLARPLLEFTRGELRRYALQQAISWVDDPSNAAEHFDRNFLRHRVLPLLAERWPAWSATLARSAGHCGEARHLLDTLLAPRLRAVSGSRAHTLSVAALANLDPAMGRELLRHWIRERGHRPPDRLRLQRIIDEVLSAAADRQPLVEWPGSQVRRYRDDLFLLAPLPPLPANESIHWAHGDMIELGRGLGVLRAQPAGTADRLRRDGSLSIRFGVAALRCRPGPDRPHRALKHLYQEQGVPQWLRPYIPLLFRDDTLLAVGGIWRCGSADSPAITPWRLSWAGHPFEDLF